MIREKYNKSSYDYCPKTCRNGQCLVAALCFVSAAALHININRHIDDIEREEQDSVQELQQDQKDIYFDAATGRGISAIIAVIGMLSVGGAVKHHRKTGNDNNDISNKPQ